MMNVVFKVFWCPSHVGQPLNAAVDELASAILEKYRSSLGLLEGERNKYPMPFAAVCSAMKSIAKRVWRCGLRSS